MASEFPAMLFYTNPEAGYDVTYETFADGATFLPYALVVKTAGEIDECGADPALIHGVAMAAAVDPNTPYPEGKVPVCRLNPLMTVGLAVAGTIAEVNAGTDYGITKSAAGNWKLDIAKTGASARFYVARVEVDRQIAIGHFLAANLQGDAIAS